LTERGFLFFRNAFQNSAICAALTFFS